MDLLNGFAHQLALAIERARLADEVVAQQRLEREVEVARGIQASFLPDACPIFPGWEVCSHWQVARRVGGDFYDFIPLTLDAEEGQRWGVVIADVADKGVPAALFMALSRTLLRAAAAPGDDPGETLRQVNNLILADTRSDLFVTVYYLVLEPHSGRATYAVGGHNPPVLVRAGGEGALLPGRGPALGLMPGVEYANHELLFEPGDVLLLYTDGITEAINTAEEEFGVARLMQVASERRAASAAEIMQAVASAVEAHAEGMEAFDDQTLVVIKRQFDRAQRMGAGGLK
ncbi:MAG: serine/threonine-protein phosphatase [Chloroflexi bacterium]|nr:serine/threonine-protein phosphatase [Chloroflexota bacterium]